MQKQKKGSLTVEAALLMPAVLSAFIFFLYLLRILYVEIQLDYASAAILENTASCGYLLKYADEAAEQEIGKSAGENEYYAVAGQAGDVLRGLADSGYFCAAIRQKLQHPEVVEKTVKGGIAGITYRGSEVYAEDEMTTIHMKYVIEFPVFSSILPGVVFEKQWIMRSFSGEGTLEFEQESEEESEEGYVYVTETGSVYHVSANCTYIRLKVEQCIFGEIDTRRNANGGKYYACAACCKSGDIGSGSIVFITQTGTHYHSLRECSKIKREVKRITITEAQAYRPCSRCAAGSQQKKE